MIEGEALVRIRVRMVAFKPLPQALITDVLDP